MTELGDRRSFVPHRDTNCDGMLVTAGARVFSVAATGEGLATAEATPYRNVRSVYFATCFCADIGLKLDKT